MRGTPLLRRLCVSSIGVLLLGSSLVALSLFVAPVHAQSVPTVFISTPNAVPGSIVDISGAGFSSQDHYVNVSVLQSLSLWYFTAVTGTDCSTTAPGYAPPSGTYLCPANGVVETGGNVPAGDCPVTSVGSFDCLFIVPALPKYASPCPSAGDCAGDEYGTLHAYGDSNDHASTHFSVLDGLGLVPNEGSPGTQVTMYGDGWFGCFVSKYGGVCDVIADYNWDAQYLLENAILFKFNTNCLPAPSGDIGQAGSGSCTFYVPNNSTGVHTVTLTSYFPLGITDKSQSASFLIVPPTVSATVSGKAFSVEGFGFSTHDTSVDVQVSRLVGNVYTLFLTQLCPSSEGAFSCTIDAGQTLSPGPDTVLAQGVNDAQPVTEVVSVVGSYPISFDPGAVFPGQTVRVTGYGFQYSDGFAYLSLDGGSAVYQLEACPVNDGIMSCIIIIPSSVTLASTLTLSATGDVGRDVETGTLNVYPIVSSNPLSGPPGTVIKVNGTGFSLGDVSVALSVAGHSMGNCSTLAVVNNGIAPVLENTGGFTSCALTIPQLPPGTYDLLATGNAAKDQATSLLFVGGATVSPDVVFANNPPPTVTVTGTNVGFTQYGPAGLQFVSDGVAELTDPGIAPEFCPVTDGSFSCPFPAAYALGVRSIGISGWALFPGSGCPIPGYSNHRCAQEPISYEAPLTVYDQAAVSLACAPDPAVATQGAQTTCTATVTDTAHGGTPPGGVAWTYSGPIGGQLSASSCTLVGLPPPSNEPSLVMPSACSVELTLPQASGTIEINVTYSGARGSVNYNPATGDVVLLPLTLQSSGVGGDATGPLLNIAGTGYGVSQLPITVWGTYGENLAPFGATVPASTGKQYALSSFTGCGGSQLPPPLTITTQCSTITANYIAQYYFSSAQDSSVVSSGYSQLVPALSSLSPASGWYNTGSQINATDSYYSIGEAYGVQDVVASFTATGSAPAGGSCQVPSVLTTSRTHCSVVFDIRSPSSVTWVWAQQYLVSFQADGIGTDTGSAVVLTVDGSSYQESQLPFSGLFLSRTPTTYSFSSPVSGTSGDRYVWAGESGLASSQSGTITATGPGSVDATYKTQYLQTFSSGGLEKDASGTLVSATVTDGQPGGTQTFTAPDGGGIFVDAGATVSYSYQSQVGSSSPGTRYGLTGVSGLPTGYAVLAPNTITGEYVAQYLVGFASSGIGTDTGSNSVATVGGTTCPQSQLPFTSWYDSGSSIAYSFSSPVSAGDGKQYVWTGTSGLGQTLQSGTLTVSSPGTVTGAYKTQYLQAFAASGLGSDAAGVLVSVTISGGAPAGSQTFSTPIGGSLFVDEGASVAYTFSSPIASTTPGQQYRLSGLSGPSSGYAASGANTITGEYIVQYLLTLTVAPSGLSPVPTTSPASSTGYYDEGTSVSLTAGSVPGYVFVNWIVDGANQTELAGAIAVTMSGPHAATAAYQTSVPAIRTLITLKDGMNLPHGIATSLDAKLSAALDSLNNGQDNAAVNQLNAFINEANAQTGKDISQSQAQLLTTFAHEITNAIDSS